MNNNTANFDHSYFLIAGIVGTLSSTIGGDTANALLGACQSISNPLNPLHPKRSFKFPDALDWLRKATEPRAIPTINITKRSAKEQWEYYKGTPEKPGPWADQLKSFNDGEGLSAMDDPYPEGLMSFIGLENIKLQALNFVREKVDFKRTTVAASSGGDRLNYFRRKPRDRENDHR